MSVINRELLEEWAIMVSGIRQDAVMDGFDDLEWTS